MSAGATQSDPTSAHDADPVAPPRWPFAVLLRFRLVQLRNMIDQQLKDAPVRTFLVLLLLLLIWAALYAVFVLVLRQIGRYELVALVARKQIFIYFFVVLAVMLAFSNAILSFGSLFGRRRRRTCWRCPRRRGRSSR